MARASFIWPVGQRRMRILVVFVTVLLLGRGGSAWEHVSAEPEAQRGLEVTSSVTYDLRLEDGPVRVSWDIRVYNGDPSTAAARDGYVYYYSSLGVPILRGATGIAAFGPTGSALSVSTIDRVEGPVVIAEVYFGQGVFYGESYQFSLSYELRAARSELLLITPSYVFLPAIGDGYASTTVTIKKPPSNEWDVSTDPQDCSETGAAVYQCGPSEMIPVAAFVELSRPQDVKTTATTVDLAEGLVAVTIRYFPGEEAWAAHLREVIAAALPVLETIYGTAYPGPLAFAVAERGRSDLVGYEGIYNCQSPSACELGISPIGDDATTLHELAHFWTDVFSERWLIEGWAEFAAQRAAEELSRLVEVNPRPAAPETVALDLDDWGAPLSWLSANEEQRAKEYVGYQKSVRLLERLEQTVGLEALQAVNALANEEANPVDSRRYLDLLEGASGAHLDGVFLEWVFPESEASILQDRRAVRDRYERARDETQAAGLTLPERLDRLLRLWLFDQADEMLADAEAAREAYVDARDTLDQPRSWWQRIGLLNKDPDGALDHAASSFADGDFEGASAHADSARETIEGASRAALLRALIAAGILAALVGGAVGIVRLRRRRAFG